MLAVKSINESSIRVAWKSKIEKFIRHEVWQTSELRRGNNNQLWRRIESRLIEMKVRRKRLMMDLFRKEAKVKKKKGLEVLDEKQFMKEYEK